MESKMMSDTQQSLAQAIWFTGMARDLHLPQALQIHLLQAAGGLGMLWKNERSFLDGLIQVQQDTQAEGLNDRSRAFLTKDLEKLQRRWLDVKVREAAEVEAYRCRDRSISACDCGNPDFPYRLKEISGCPAILYFRGADLSVLNSMPLCVTMIGTRLPSPYGRRVTERLAAELALYEIALISGLARGIDTQVHRIALECKGFTVAVLGCGADVVYPPENQPLQEQIAANGLLISEHPPGTKPLRQYFPARNRILSGLADLVIVTESTCKSGTLLTAGFAADQGREVYAVPGNILNKTSSGCHSLIRDGAILLESAQEILSEHAVGRRMEAAAGSDKIKNGTQPNVTGNGREAARKCDSHDKRMNGDSPLERKVVNCLRTQGLDLSALAQMTGEPVNQIASAITLMEIAGQIENSRGRYFLTDA